ncbi:hypothetical protein K0M31_000156 [Melipona bicolor]|uniref:Uncharacterized protein n=1 Tax=Melipona bicolor TaxID=60889 RepID=A0AA40GD66_9HYME|nr:hypothetical protein K0M31_000156 [Melipona bicolor]
MVVNGERRTANGRTNRARPPRRAAWCSEGLKVSDSIEDSDSEREGERLVA